jgi:hypothetical protein
MRILRTLRGIAVTAVTWAVVWAPFSFVSIGLAAFAGQAFSPRLLAIIVANQIVVGAINGAVFAGALAIAGRRRTFESLSMPLMVACGAIGGTLFPFGIRTLILSAGFGIHQPVTTLVTTLITNALLGAGCAALSLKLARRAPALGRGPDIPSIDAGDAAFDHVANARPVPVRVR